jgi:hypothetical protein
MTTQTGFIVAAAAAGGQGQTAPFSPPLPLLEAMTRVFIDYLNIMTELIGLDNVKNYLHARAL